MPRAGEDVGFTAPFPGVITDVANNIAMGMCAVVHSMLDMH